MEYNKEYFRRRVKESLKKYEEASEVEREKMRRTATWMADKARPNGDNFLFFYGSDSTFSQWYRCKFMADNFSFTCTEQYMMYRKALLFSDKKIADKIVRIGYNPGEHKSLGREVSSFVQEVWDMEKQNIVYQGNYYKFTQSIELKKSLLGTTPKTLVEASPVDKIWGIGLSIDDPSRFDINNWEGENLLGFILTRLREDLLQERSTS